MSRSRTVGALVAAIRLLRPGNALMAAVGAGVGMLATGAPLRHPEWAWLAPLAVLLVTACGNVLNDLADVELDRRAHPGRPLPSGAIRPRSAALVALACALGALAAAWHPRDPTLLAFVAGALALLVAYELWLKRLGLPGNLAVAILAAATFACGAAATTRPAPEWGGLWALVAMALLATVAREVAKDIEDQDADRGRRRTLPHRIGAGAAGMVAMAAAGAAVAANLGWLAASGAWAGPLGAVIVADLFILGGAARSATRPATAQSGLKLGMAVALVAYLADGALARTGVGGF